MFSVFLTSSLPSTSLFPVNVTGEEEQMDEGQSVIGLMHALPCYFVFSDVKGCFLSTYVVQLLGPVITIIILVNAMNSKALK